MKRKSFIVSIVAIIISLFSLSYSFAANNTITNMRDGIRNTIGGAENVVEGTVQGGMNLVGNGTRAIGNTTENTVGAMTNDGNNDEYTATRTTTRMGTANNTAGGISTTTYTWVIIGVTAVAIGILLWSFFAQKKKNDLYIDSNDR